MMYAVLMVNGQTCWLTAESAERALEVARGEMRHTKPLCVFTAAEYDALPLCELRALVSSVR